MLKSFQRVKKNVGLATSRVAWVMIRHGDWIRWQGVELDQWGRGVVCGVLREQENSREQLLDYLGKRFAEKLLYRRTRRRN